MKKDGGDLKILRRPFFVCTHFLKIALLLADIFTVSPPKAFKRSPFH